MNHKPFEGHNVLKADRVAAVEDVSSWGPQGPREDSMSMAEGLRSMYHTGMLTEGGT